MSSYSGEASASSASQFVLVYLQRHEHDCLSKYMYDFLFSINLTTYFLSFMFIVIKASRVIKLRCQLLIVGIEIIRDKKGDNLPKH